MMQQAKANSIHFHTQGIHSVSLFLTRYVCVIFIHILFAVLSFSRADFC